MPRDPRRFKGRSKALGMIAGGLAGLGGADGGGMEIDPDAIAQVASDTPYDDPTFNANNIMRVKPISGVKNWLSGDKAGAASRDFNLGQAGSEAEARQAFTMQPFEDKQKLDYEGKLADVKAQSAIDQVKKLNAYKYDTDVNRLASTRGNEQDDWAIYSPDDNDIPTIDKQYARDEMTRHGNQLDSLGTSGVADKRLADKSKIDEATSIAKLRDEQIKKMQEDKPAKWQQHSPGVQYNSVDDEYRILIPAGVDDKGNPTPTKFEHRNGEWALLKTKGAIEPSPDGKVVPSPVKPKVSSVGNALKSVGSKASSLFSSYNEPLKDAGLDIGDIADKVVSIPRDNREVSPTASLMSVRKGRVTGYPKAESTGQGNAGAMNKIVQLIQQEHAASSQQERDAIRNNIQALEQTLPEGYLDVEQLRGLLKN